MSFSEEDKTLVFLIMINDKFSLSESPSNDLDEVTKIVLWTNTDKILFEITQKKIIRTEQNQFEWNNISDWIRSV